MLRIAAQRTFTRSTTTLVNTITNTNINKIPACHRSLVTFAADFFPSHRQLHSISAQDTDDADCFGSLDPRFLDSKSKNKYEGKSGKMVPNYKELFKAREELKSESLENVIEDEDEMTSELVSDPDTFGTLLEESEFKLQYGDALPETEVDDDDGTETDRHIRLSIYDRKHPQAWYVHRLVKMSKRGEVLDAVKMLREEMIAKDRVMPNSIAFTVVISALAKAGYTKLAFKLFREMRAMGLKAPRQVFSALFNACANCSNKEEGLKMALYLKDYIIRKNVVLHYISYKAGMKAFAFCKDLKSAFAYLDEALENGHKLDLEAVSMLLMACISDKEYGFKYAIQIWRIMLAKQIIPDIYQYNLLVRCVKECGIGEQSDIPKMLQTSPSAKLLHEVRVAKPKKFRLATSNTVESSLIINKESIPDVLAPNPVFDNILALQKIETSCDRLALLGGVSSLLERMRKDDAKPDVKTFSLLVDSIESCPLAEESLLKWMKVLKVKPDTPFCNLVMRKRVFRQDYKSARELSSLMNTHDLKPDLHTYATLALTCKTKGEAVHLLQDMGKRAVVPTREIFSHLNQAAYMNFAYSRWVCEELPRRGIDPDQLFIRQCERKISSARKLLLQIDGRQQNETEKDLNFRRKFKSFMMFYKPWLMANNLYIPKSVPRKFDDLLRPVEPVKVKVEMEKQ